METDLDGITHLVTLRVVAPGQRSYCGGEAASFGLSFRADLKTCGTQL